MNVPESPFSPLQESKTENSMTVEESAELLEFFDRILCPRNIVILSTSKEKCSDVWEAMATVLVYLLMHNFLSEDSLTEQCLAVYRQDWPQVPYTIYTRLFVKKFICLTPP